MRASGQPGIMQRFFSAIAGHPLIVLSCALAAIVFFGAHALDLQKDTDAEVFIPDGHPAVYDRERLIETFGLKDPVIIAVHRSDEGGIFTPATLALVDELTQRLRTVSGIDPERVTSLSTEKSISGDEYGLAVESFLSAPPQSQRDVAAVRNAVEATPSAIGRLVSSDYSVTLVVAELLDGADAEQVYWDVIDLANSQATLDGETLHVAGTGAMLGYLGIYMDRDARTLAPLAAVLVLLSLFLANRNGTGVLIPALVILGSAAVTLGTMALLDIRFYVITNALPVILIGISVDDALHIYSDYKKRREACAAGPARAAVVETMLVMTRPVTVTTMTTAAGCLALGFSSAIPPMREFGLFTALGIMVAWLYSLTVVPAALALLPSRISTNGQQQEGDKSASEAIKTTGSRLLTYLPFKCPRSIVILSGIWILIGAVSSIELKVDEAYIDNFQPDEPIAIADSLINERGIGSNYVDILIEGDREDALLAPEVLSYVDGLQSYAESLPGVLQSVSYLDPLRQIDQALKEPGEAAGMVFDSEERAAQYLLLYTLSGDPADFRTLINNGYDSANLRLYFHSGWYSDEQKLIDALSAYLRKHEPPAAVSVTVSGVAMVHISWVGMLFDGHLTSILASLLVVWLIATISFASPLRGSLVMVPVIFAVLTVYATMVLADINLGVGTSMTAAIAIGLSIDFGVHLLHRIDECSWKSSSLEQAVAQAIQASGPAIFFSFLTGFLGFGVLALGEVPGVARFGGLVAVSLSASVLASLVLLPSLILTIRSLGARLLSTARGTLPPEHPNQRQAGNEICSSVKPSAS